MSAGRVTPLVIAGTAIYIERILLMNTFSAGRLAFACAVVGGSVGLVIWSRGWLYLGSRWNSIATLVVLGALVAIGIGIAANGAKVDWSTERFIVERKWRSYAWKIGGRPWHMFRVQSPRFGTEDIAVSQETWESTQEGQTITLQLGRGGLGFDMIRSPLSEPRR